MGVIQITHTAYETTISSDEIMYSKIRNMYKTGDGLGFQCHPDHEQAAGVICEKIVDLLDELNHISNKIEGTA